MAVLIQRTQLLTSLEIFMSIWALGYMLDEVSDLGGSTKFLGCWVLQRRQYTVRVEFVEPI